LQSSLPTVVTGPRYLKVCFPPTPWRPHRSSRSSELPSAPFLVLSLSISPTRALCTTRSASCPTRTLPTLSIREIAGKAQTQRVPGYRTLIVSRRSLLLPSSTASLDTPSSLKTDHVVLVHDSFAGAQRQWVSGPRSNFGQPSFASSFPGLPPAWSSPR
jgi:hypothetical protein